jgi:phosphotransacetylase
MKPTLDSLVPRAKERSPRIGLIDQGDGSMEAAAAALEAKGLGPVSLIGPDPISPGDDKRVGAVAAVLRECWPERVRDGIHALDLAAHPLLFAAGLTARGDLDVCLAGTAVPLDAMEEAARWVTGAARRAQGRGHIAYLSTVDGRLLTLVLPDSAGPLDPKGIASLILMASTHRGRVVGDAPRVGILVAPPSQDASHADAELALAELRAQAPGITASVEWSWGDSDESEPGRFRTGPNVLIFPGPVTGHLAQLLLRDAAGLKAWGPLFPGGRWALAGVPEGATPSDIAAVAILAAAGLAAA